MVAPALAAAGLSAAGSLIGGKMSADATESAAGKAAAASAPVPFSSPLYNTRFIGTGADRFLSSQLTPQAQQISQGLLSDFESIPFSQLTQPGFEYGSAAEELLPRADEIYGRAQTALDRGATPEAAYGFLQRALGPELEQQRLQQETRLANQGLLGATAGALQTEALGQGQQQALLQGALGQQQFQAGLGRGLLGDALNYRSTFTDINLARAQQDLAERQFLSNLRANALSGGIGLLSGAQDAGALTLRSGSPQGSAQAAALGAQGQQQMAGNIAAGLQSIGLGLAGMQEQPSTSNLSTGTYSSGSFLPGGGTGFSGTSSFSAPIASGFSGTTPFLLPNR